jgi:predicted DNA-binding transcriptional regulator AlpA
MTETFLRIGDVQAATGLGRSTLYRLIEQKQFPPPVKLGLRASAWLASEVADWQKQRIAQSRGGA